MRALSVATRDAALGIGLALAASAVLYPRALMRGEVFFERDLHLDWYPRVASIARSVSEGAWPLWDPSVAFGHPLLADPGAQVAYPVTWLAAALPMGLAYTAFVLVHLALTAVGAARLGRAAGGSTLAAVTAAAFWILSGPLQSAVNLWHHFAGLCWAPWVLLAADRAARRPGTRTALALGVAGGLQALAGSADACAMSWGAALLWGALRARRRARAAGAAAAGIGIAAALGAIVWLPAADVLSRSQRRELPADVRTAWSVPPAGLLRLVAPLDPARVPFSEAGWTALYDRAGYPLLYSAYVGPPVVLLAAAALADRARRARALLALAMALGGVGIALGPHGFLYPLATSLLPPLRIFRYPSKALLLVALLGALAAAIGAGALARGRLSRRSSSWLALLSLALPAAAVLAAARSGARLDAPTVLAAAVALPLLLHALGAASARICATAVVGLSAAGLLAAHEGLNATAPAELVLAPPPLVSLVDRTEGRRLYVYDYHTVPGTSERLLGRPNPYPLRPDAAGGDARQREVLALRQYLPPPAAGLFALEGSYDFDIRGMYPEPLDAITHLLRAVEGTPAHAKLLRLGAVGTVASLHRRGLEDLQPVALVPGLFENPIVVWRVPGARPRAWTVACSRTADGPADELRALADAGFDPSREVLLAGGPAVRPECGEAGPVRRLAAPADRVRLEATLARPGFAVLADTWDPGWRATVDGAPAEVLRANVAFRAVALPAGHHVVEMAYRPRAAAVGLLVSLSTLAAVALAAVRRSRVRRA